MSRHLRKLLADLTSAVALIGSGYVFLTILYLIAERNAA